MSTLDYHTLNQKLGTFRHRDLDEFCSVAKRRLNRKTLISEQFDLRSEFGRRTGTIGSKKDIYCKLQNGEICNV